MSETTTPRSRKTTPQRQTLGEFASALARLRAENDTLAAHLAAALARIERLEQAAYPQPVPALAAIEAEREARFVPAAPAAAAARRGLPRDPDFGRQGDRHRKHAHRSHLVRDPLTGERLEPAV